MEEGVKSKLKLSFLYVKKLLLQKKKKKKKKTENWVVTPQTAPCPKLQKPIFP